MTFFIVTFVMTLYGLVFVNSIRVFARLIGSAFSSSGATFRVSLKLAKVLTL